MSDTDANQERWQAIRDHDERYLAGLSDALSMASAAFQDGLHAAGLRVVREDRPDPPQEAFVERVEALIAKYRDDKASGADYSGRVPARRVVADLCDLLKPDPEPHP